METIVKRWTIMLKNHDQEEIIPGDDYLDAIGFVWLLLTLFWSLRDGDIILFRLSNPTKCFIFS